MLLEGRSALATGKRVSPQSGQSVSRQKNVPEYRRDERSNRGRSRFKTDFRVTVRVSEGYGGSIGFGRSLEAGSLPHESSLNVRLFNHTSVSERLAAQNNEVRVFSGFERADTVGDADGLCRIDGHGF